MECVVVNMLMTHNSILDILCSGCCLILGWTKANRLKLNLDKMEILLLGGPSESLGDSLPTLDWVTLTIRKQVRNLDVLLDPAPSCDSQIEAVSRLAFNQLRPNGQLCPYPDWRRGC